MTIDQTTNPWDEAVLEVALEDVFSESADEVVPAPGGRRPMLVAAAAILVVALVAVVQQGGLGGAASSPQDPVDAQDPKNVAHWGLLPGSEWVYRVRTGDGSSRWTEGWCANGWVHPEQGPPVLELMGLDKHRTTFRHLGTNPDGLVEYAPSAGAEHPVFDPDATFLVLPLRLGIRTGWSTTQSYEASASVGEGPVGLGFHEQRDRKLEASLEAPEVEVVVPAGTFRCARIRYEHTAEDEAFETWWSPVAGRVKEVVFENGAVVRTIELQEFRPGNARIDARAGVAAEAIRDWCEANLGEQVEWTWVVPGFARPAPKSRFALLPTPEGRRVLRIHGDQVSEFEWSDHGHVEAWLRDERWFRPATSAAHPALATGVAVLLARCRAEQKGQFLLEPGKKTVSATTSGTVGADITCGLQNFDGENLPQTSQLLVEITKAGTIVALRAQTLR